MNTMYAIHDELVLAPFETKNAPDDDDGDIADQIAELAKNMKDGHTAIETKVARLIDDAVKAQTTRANELERKLNRLHASGLVGGDKDTGDLDAERKALGLFVKTGDETSLREIEQKSMSVGDDPNGGYFVMPAMSTTMIKRLHDISPMRRLAREQPMSVGDKWVEPIDKDDAEASWVGERQSRPNTDTPEGGLLDIPLQEIYANAKVTQRLLDDSPMNIGAWVEQKVTDKFGRKEGTAFVIGDGMRKPRGFLTYEKSASDDFTRPSSALQFKVSGHATSITTDALRDLFWSLRAPHRINGTWLMASQTAAVVDKLKDGEGRYIWRPSEAAGVPPTLLGRPVEFAEDMPGVEAGAFPIAFGDWKEGYIIVDRPGIKWNRDTVTDKPNVQFYGYRRVGGAVANSDAIKLLKIAAS